MKKYLDLKNTVTPYCEWNYIETRSELDEYVEKNEEKDHLHMDEKDYERIVGELPTWVGHVYEADRIRIKRHYIDWREFCEVTNRMRRRLLEAE